MLIRTIHRQSLKYLNISFINTLRYYVIPHATASAFRIEVAGELVTRTSRKTTAYVKLNVC